MSSSMEGAQVKENSSSALPSTVMVDGVLYRFTLRPSSDVRITGESKYPRSPLYADLSLYPPGTHIESELHWDGSGSIARVPLWAHEKWLRKLLKKNAGEDDTSPTEDDDDDPSYAAAAADGAKPPSEDRPKSKGPTPEMREAVAGQYRRFVSAFGPKHITSPPPSSNQGTNARKRPGEDLVENPSPTAAAYGTKAEAGGLSAPEPARAFPFAYSYAYVDPRAAASASDGFEGKYGFFFENGRMVYKRDEYATPYIKFGGDCGVTSSVKFRPGVYHTNQVPKVWKTDEFGNVYRAS